MLSFLFDNNIIQGRDGGSTSRANATAGPKALRPVCTVILVEAIYALLNCWFPISGDCKCWHWKKDIMLVNVVEEY